jgi:hypothetical protein
MKNRKVCLTIEFGTQIENDQELTKICYSVLRYADQALTISKALDAHQPGRYEVTVEDPPGLPPKKAAGTLSSIR